MGRAYFLLVALAIAGCSHAVEPPTVPTSQAATHGSTPMGADYAVLYRFGPLPDGNSPATELVLVNQSGMKRLYGTTYGGGVPSQSCPNGCGTIYSIDPAAGSSSYSQLYSFHGGSSDGALPNSGLNHNGGVSDTLFGTTFFGGRRGLHCYLRRRCGTVYSVNTSGSEHVLHKFDGTDGANPFGGRHYDDVQRVFFGTTEYGGRRNFGAVYSVDIAGNEQRLYSFKGGPHDGAYPVGTLAAKCSLTACRLFGVTLQGGAINDGAIFAITLQRDTGEVSERLIHSFTPSEGDEPLGGLELSVDQLSLYGAASRDGANNRGSIFEYTLAPVPKFTILHSFDKGGDGELPYVRPMLFYSGVHKESLYGTTQEGGAYGSGTVYAIMLNKGNPVECVLHSFPDPSVRGGDGLRPDSPLRQFGINHRILFYGTTVQGPRIGHNNKGYGTIYQISPSAPCQDRSKPSGHRAR